MGQCGTVNSYPVLVAQKEEERREFLLIGRSSPTPYSHEPHVTCGQWAAASGSAAGYLRRIRIVVRMRCFLEERTYEET